MLRRILEQYFIFISLLLLVVFFSFTANNFFSFSTFSTLLNQLPALTVVTIGMTLVLISGGIDLSVGSVAALSGGVIGIASTLLDLPLPIAGLMGVAAGLLAGTLSGWLGGYCGLPVFIVTLGMLEAARGMAYLTTNSQTVYIGANIQKLALPLPYIGVSASFLFAIGLVLVAHLLLTRTVFGRYLVAIGTNAKAARISGIDIKPYMMSVLVISGGLAGVAGLMNTAYLGSADPNAGMGLELAAIAAAVIGGTSLMGGRGSIIGAFIGVLIISVLQNGLAQLGVTEPIKRLITGAVIILAVCIDRWRSGAAVE
ncbi:MAG: ABC transporter permease [Alteromonadaceae bacterium]|nr:MAG: ABC transporter permease [Alteromonadaceae bacterium]